MTTTVPNCSGTRRRGVVYGVDLIDHATGLIRRCDYVGQTRQLLRTRGNQHRDVQPWSDLIVGEFYVIAEGWWTDTELDAMEEQLILDRRPRMNWLLNESNPEQIPKWVQRDERWARDDAARLSRWVHPDDRTSDGVRQSTPILPERRVWVPRSWSAVQRWICLSCVAWATSSTIVWAVLARNDWLQSTARRGLSAAIVCLTALLLARWLTPQRRRRIAKAWRKFRRWCR